MVLLVDEVRPGRQDFVGTLAPFRQRVGRVQIGADAPVEGFSISAAVIGAPNALGVGRVGDDAVEAKAAEARLPLGAGVVFGKAGHLNP